MKEGRRGWEKLEIEQKCGSAEKKPWREEMVVEDCARAPELAMLEREREGRGHRNSQVIFSWLFPYFYP